MKISAVILSAGLSSRMGSFKPLLDIGGVPALQRTCSAFFACSLPVFVITGYRSGELSPLISSIGAEEIHNPDYENGMFTSIRAGVLRAYEKGDDGILLCPADCALVTEAAVRLVLDAAEAEPERFSVVCFAGKKGHPLFIPKKYFPEIIAHNGENGLKGVTLKYEAGINRIDTMEEGVILDMDTPEGYRELCGYYDGSLPRLSELMRGRRLILTRHGETRQHSGKMFIGSYDVPLSEKGLEDAAAAAERIKALNPEAAAVYSSPLSRALKTAEFAAGALRLPVIIDERLTELSLGAWDGLSIDEVKARFPEQYAERGRNIAGYKVPGGESFYELMQRSAAFLRSVLLKDSSPDIVIIAHKGVINCLEALMTERSADFLSKTPAKGETVTVRYSPSGI